MFKIQNEELLNIKKDNGDHIFITVAGNVGAGKSTLTRMVGEKLGLDTHYEKVAGNPYLEDFYQEGVIPHPQPQVGLGCKPNIKLMQN